MTQHGLISAGDCFSLEWKKIGSSPLQCCLLLQGSPDSGLCFPVYSCTCLRLRVALQIWSPSNWVSLFSSCGGVCGERENWSYSLSGSSIYQAYTHSAAVWRLWEEAWVMYLLFLSACLLHRVRDEWWGLSVLDEGCVQIHNECFSPPLAIQTL